MPTAELIAPPAHEVGVTPEAERTPAARKRELKTIAPRMLAGEAQIVAAKDRDTRTPGERSLLLYDQLLHGDKLLSGVDWQEKQILPFLEGKPLVLPETKVRIDDGTEGGRTRVFVDGEAALAGITSLETSADGQSFFYYGPLKDATSGQLFFVKDGKERKVTVKAVGKETEEQAYLRTVDLQAKEGFSPIQTRVPLRAAADAQLIAERGVIADTLGDAKKPLLEPFVATLPRNDKDGQYEPPEDIDPALEAAAQEAGLPTVGTIKAALEKQFPTDMPAEITSFLAKINGNVLLEKGDFAEAMQHMGVDSSVLTGQIDALLDQHKAAKESLKALEAQEVPEEVLQEARGRVEDIEGQMVMLQSTKNSWEQAVKDGNSPVDAFYDGMMTGDLDPETAKGVMEGIRTGNLDKVIESVMTLLPNVPDVKGWTPEQKAIAMKYLKNGARGIGLAAMIAAAIALVVVVGAGTFIGQGMKQ